MVIEQKKIQELIEDALEKTRELAWDYPMEFDTKKGVVLFSGPGDIGTKIGDKISEGQAVEYALWFSNTVEEIVKHGSKALKQIKKGKVAETKASILLSISSESRFGESEIWSEVLKELNKFYH